MAHVRIGVTRDAEFLDCSKYGSLEECILVNIYEDYI